MQDEMVSAGVRAANTAGAASIISGTVAGLSLPDWAAIISGVYFLISIGLLVPDIIDKYRKWKGKKDVAGSIEE